MRRCPAFFYGLFALIGAASAFFFHWSYLCPTAVLIFLAEDKKKIFIGLAFLLAAFVYAKTGVTFPEISQEKTHGSGLFRPDSVSLQSSPFHQRSIVYRGVLKTFTTDNGTTWKTVPCRIYPKQERLPANTDFYVTGTLIQKGPQNYVLKPESISPSKDRWRIAEARFQAKEKLHRFLKSALPNKQARSFLTSMLTGDVDERTLSLEFNKLGLQHILGVSGFQFVLLASLAGFFLRLFLPYKASILCLLVFLTGYFVLLGNSPPVQRAWIGISIFLIGILANLRCSPLNALGAALLCEIFLDPPVIGNIGFQLSFLCTFAILQIYPVVRRWAALCLPIRPFNEVLKMDLWNQHGYLSSAVIRETLSLNLAVHLAALPALLCLFHKFPLLSLAYNLFFPAGATIAFILMVIALPLSFLIPPLSQALFYLCNLWTAWLLNLVSHPPAIAEIYIRVSDFPLGLAVILLTFFLLLLNEKPGVDPF